MNFATRVPALPRPDFAARARSHRRLAHGLLLAALLWLGGAVAEAWDLREQLASARAEQSRWEARRTRLVVQQTRRSAPALPEEWRFKAWRIHDALHFSWGGMLASVEARARPGVHWLAMDIDRERGALRLEGIAVDPAAALGIVDALAALPGFSDVVLARLSAQDGAVDAGQRFEVSARVDFGSATALERSP